ncbi:MAG: hypothetical protein J7494_09965 [Sphingobium sp.]|nr:hypothetical protein [Sphingobium sp.]
MKKTIFAIAAASLALAAAAGVSAQPNGHHNGHGNGDAKGEARLAKLLEGRVAGKPVSCISAQISDRLQIIDKTALVYDGGRTVYVARPHDSRSLDSDNILVINRFGSQLCKQDVIRTVDRYSGFMTGVVFLDDFVPYTKR